MKIRSKNEQWKEGMIAIDKNVDAIHDDLIDKGWDDDEAINRVLNTERVGMQKELSANIDGDFSHPYEKGEYVDLNNIEYPDEYISPRERLEAETPIEDNDYFIENDIDIIPAELLSTNEPIEAHIPSDEELYTNSEDKGNDYQDSEQIEQDEQASDLINNENKGEMVGPENEDREEHANDLISDGSGETSGSELNGDQEEQASDLSNSYNNDGAHDDEKGEQEDYGLSY